MAFDWTERRRKAALRRLEEFEATPHLHRRATPGVGVDCVHLVIEALKAGGAVAEDFTVPGYSRNEGIGKRRNFAADLFIEAFNVHEVGTDEITDGDVLFFTVNRTTNHLGICMGGDVWHCLWTAGVVRDNPTTIAPRIQTVLRFSKAGRRTTKR